jgi:hypothetical protein
MTQLTKKEQAFKDKLLTMIIVFGYTHSEASALLEREERSYGSYENAWDDYPHIKMRLKNREDNIIICKTLPTKCVGNQYIVRDDMEPENGDMVLTEKYGIWEFKDEGRGSAPMPYWANKKTCKKLIPVNS